MIRSSCGSPPTWAARLPTGCAATTARSGPAVAAAATDAERAAALSRRGRAYGEKARYARATKLLPLDEYRRVFDLAIADHDRAIALARIRRCLSTAGSPTTTGASPCRRTTGRRPPNRAASRPSRKPTSRAPSSSIRSSSWPTTGAGSSASPGRNSTERSGDFETVRGFDRRLGKIRLADTYCARAGVAQKNGLVDAAIGDYQKSIDQDAPRDGCDCDPYRPLASLYLDAKRDHANAWRIVHAAKGNRYIPPEFLERLERESRLQN